MIYPIFHLLTKILLGSNLEIVVLFYKLLL